MVPVGWPATRGLQRPSSADRVLEAVDRWGTSARVLSNILAGVLGFAKKHQEGRARGDLASARFSEYWFRTSGLYEIVTGVLETARSHQDGRVTSEVTSVTFGEYWFRTSGLYDLNRDGVDSWDVTPPVPIPISLRWLLAEMRRVDHRLKGGCSGPDTGFTSPIGPLDSTRRTARRC